MKCLVTRLACDTNNESLPIFNAYVVYLRHWVKTEGRNNNLRIVYNDNNKISFEIIDPTNKAYFTDSTYTQNLGKVLTSENAPANDVQYIVNPNNYPVKMIIRNAVNVTKLFDWGVDTALFVDSANPLHFDFVYPALTSFAFNNVYIDFDTALVKDTALTYMTLIQKTPKRGDIGNLPSTLVTLTAPSDGINTSFSGNIETAPFINVEKLGLRFHFNITGNLEKFLERCCAVRSTGTLKYFLNGTNIKFHNESIASGEHTVTFNSTGCVITNSSSHTIGTYANSTWTYA